jgi:hypothetical protein
MNTFRIVTFAWAWTALVVGTAYGQDLATYRNFHLGASLATIAARAGVSPEPRVIFRHPALLQELMWQPAASDAQLPEAVRKVVFSFYNDELFRIVVDYDPRRTAGMTSADMIDALSKAFGLATLPSTGFLPLARSTIGNGGALIVSWEDADHSASLTSRPPSIFALVMTSKRVAALATVAAADATWMERLDAPLREAELAQQQTQASRDKEEAARHVNRAAFRP